MILVRHLELEFPEGPVFFRIRGRVRDGVLGAHLVLDFLEDVIQRILAIHFEHAPAGFIRHLLQLAFPAAAIHPRIGVVDAVDDRVRQLGLANRLFADLAAPGIDAVGDHHDNFAAHFALQSLIRRQIYRVPQHRASLVLRGRNRTRMQPADRNFSAAA